MNNFLDFIEKDIVAKKGLIATLPTKTKTNIRKYNDSIIAMEKKYEEYKSSVRNYLLAKTRSFKVKEQVLDSEKLLEEVATLERVRFLLNPINTYFEKTGFDNLLYQINYYSDFDFNALAEIINGFLDKFDLINVKLTSYDFTYTPYVHEFMKSFFEVRDKKLENYDKVAEIFEKIYWLNPEIIEHIELNFRKLIRENEKKFNSYIAKLQEEAMRENKITSYSECISKLKKAYSELNHANSETITDIIEFAKNGTIDINQYFSDNKVRIATYSSLIDENIDSSDKNLMGKIFGALERLKDNIEEYSNYLEFIPLINNFKNEYQSLIPTDSKKNEYKGVKEIFTKILENEKILEKINKKIFNGKSGLFGIKDENIIKQLKIDSINKAKELYQLYIVYDREFFKDKVLSILNSSLTIADFLELYYSFDYFKKIAIKKVANVTSYADIVKYSDRFDLFAMDPTNIIVNGVPLFEETNIAKVIANKYRLSNIKLTEEDIRPESLKGLISKIEMLIRINKIEESTTTVDKIWFMAQIEKFLAKEKINE